MAIGDVRARFNPLQSARVGIGTAGALNNLAGAFGEAGDVFEAELRERERQEAFDADARWADLQGELARDQTRYLDEVAADTPNIAENQYHAARTRTDEFLASLPEKLRREYKPAVNNVVQTLTTNAFNHARELRVTHETDVLGRFKEARSGDIAAGNASAASATAAFMDMVDKSVLPVSVRSSIIEQAHHDFLKSQFGREVRGYHARPGALKNPKAGDVATGGLSPGQRAFLNVTAGPESGGKYNVRYNGATAATFDDYTTHPAIPVEVPRTLDYYTEEELQLLESGAMRPRTSTAAGRYQITAQTWGYIQEHLNLPDFSPNSQDIAALWLAEDRYNKLKGDGDPTWEELINNPSDAELSHLKELLTPTWLGLKTLSDEEFASAFRGVEGIAGGGTGYENLPDIWTSPEYASLTLSEKEELWKDAVRANNARDAEISAAKEEYGDRLLARIRLGEAKLEDVNLAVKNNQVRPEDIPGLYSAVQNEIDLQRDALDYQKALTNKQQLPNDKENRDKADVWMRHAKVYEGISALDPKAGEIVAQQLTHTGILPDQVMNILDGMTTSTDPRRQAYALNVLVSARQKSQENFDRVMPKNVVENTTAFQTLLRYTESGNTTAVLSKWYDWTQVEPNEALKKEIEEKLEDIDDDEIQTAFRGSFFERQAARLGLADPNVNLPQNAAARALLRQDFNRLFRFYYGLTGEATAKTIAEQMQYSWGPNLVSGNNTLTYLSPTSPAAGYPVINGSQDWMRDDIITTLKLSTDQQLETIPDAQTSGEIARGELPAYRIQLINDNGSRSLLFAPDGSVLRYRFTISEGQQNALDAQARYINTEAKIRALREERGRLFSDQSRGKISGNPALQAERERRLTEIAKELNVLNTQLDELAPTAYEPGVSPAALQHKIDEADRQLSLFLPGSQDYREWQERRKRLIAQQVLTMPEPVEE